MYASNMQTTAPGFLDHVFLGSETSICQDRLQTARYDRRKRGLKTGHCFGQGICGGAGGCAYGGPHNNGFQEIFTASLAGPLETTPFGEPHLHSKRSIYQDRLGTNIGNRDVFSAGSLELGSFVYAKGLLDNYLRYYLKVVQEHARLLRCHCTKNDRHFTKTGSGQTQGTT